MLATTKCPKCGAEIQYLEFLDRAYEYNGFDDVMYEYWGCTKCGTQGCDTYTVTDTTVF